MIHGKKSIALFPHEGNLYNQGIIYGRMSNNEKALEYFNKALNTKNYYYTGYKHNHNHNLITYVTFSWFLARNESYQSAEKIIKEGLVEYPNEGQLWEILAICEYRLHNQDKVLIAIEKAISLSQKQEFYAILSKIKNKESIVLAPFPSNLGN